MATVFQVLVHAARALDALIEGLATGGSASTVVDSYMSAHLGFSDDDEFNGGTVFIPLTTDTAAPQNESRVVTDHAASTGTLTVAPVFSAAVAAGDRYGVMTDRYPKATLLGKLNEALAEIGDIPTDYIYSTFITAAATREYLIPTAAKRDPRQLFIATNTAQPYDWQPVAHWTVRHSDAGDDAYLLLPYQPTAARLLKLVYMAPHPAVYTDAGEISDYLGLDWLGLEVAMRAARWRLNMPGDDAEKLTAKLNDLLRQLELAKRRRRIVQPPPQQIYPYFPGD